MKSLEALKHLEDKFRTSSWAKEMDFTCACFEIEKSLKALEIIKEKDVDTRYLMLCRKLDQYNDRFYEKEPRFYIGRQLTQSEFDLLKEVLL